MNAPLYTTEILRLAASLPEPAVLERVDGSAEERSQTCGSSVRLKVQLSPDGRVQALSQHVQACAFGQASAALLARSAVGRSAEDIDQALLDLRDWLGGAKPHPGSWPELDALTPARSRRSRHPAILLPFRALANAMNRSTA